MVMNVQDVLSTADKKREVLVQSELTFFESANQKFPITGIKPFNLCLKNDDNQRLYISGNTTLDVVIPCDRCLEDTVQRFSVDIDRRVDIKDGEVLAAEDEEITFLKEYELDVDRLIYDEILVNWPTKVLCKDDCKGICPVCGQNLNQQDCGCDRQVMDPRMAKFQDIFREFKEV